MTRYKKEGYRKTFTDNNGFKSSKQMFVKSIVTVRVPFFAGVVVGYAQV